MIFIDADKGGYEAYYEACLSVPGLLAEGGVIVVDNVLFKGQVRLYSPLAWPYICCGPILHPHPHPHLHLL